MDYRRKKKLTFFTIGLIFLLSGVEYAVILPTIWRYLQTLEAAPYFLGLTLSAFSLSGLLSGPLFGHWSDRTRTTKKIILLSNVFEIVGNLMYFMGYSKWLLLSSRLVAGIGAGASSSIFGFLTRITAPDDRATVFAAVMACRQAGLLIGPAFNIFLRLFDFHMGPFVVNKYTAPGLFMCLLWILLQLAVVFMYWDLPSLEKGKAKNSLASKSREEENVQGLVEGEEESDEEEKPLMGSQELVGSYGSVVASKNHSSAASNSIQNHVSPPSSPVTEETQELVGSYGSVVASKNHSSAASNSIQNHVSPPSSPVTEETQELVGSYGSVVASKNHFSAASNSIQNHVSPPSSPVTEETQESSSPFKNSSISREFLREEVVVLLAAQFITLFNQTALETMVTPLTQKYFNFGELENSVMYCLGGVVVIAGFLFVRWLSGHVAERVVLAIGLSICNVSCVWCLIFLANPLGGYAWELTEFIIGVFLQVLGLPFVAVAQVSLFSKVTSEKTQGFSQGVRRSVGGLATILGPLWAGGLTDNMYIMMGVMMGLLALLTMMLAFSYNRLVEPAAEEQMDESVHRG